MSRCIERLDLCGLSAMRTQRRSAWVKHKTTLSVLTVRRGTGRRLLYIPAALAAAVRRRVTLTARIEATLAEISAINLELLTRGELT
jgi:hypothetical protein